MLRPPPFLRQALLVIALLWSGGASAHEIRPALGEISFPENEQIYRIDFVLNLEALIAEIGPEHEDTDDSVNAETYGRLRSLPPEDLRAAFDDFAPRFLDSLALEVDGAAAAPTVLSLETPDVGDIDLPRDSTLVVSGALPPDAREIVFAWAPEFGAIVLRTELDEEGGGYSAFLRGGETTDPIPVAGGATQGGLDVFIDYVGVGFEHIVPLGLDHILFVIGLFLFSTRFRPLLIQISAFTVAHTVTLALGLFEVVRVSPDIVEPLIALSIVYVAVENIVFDRLTIWRPILVFGFGLLHGLGFAGVLSEFGLPAGQYAVGLIAFNIGVELGQLFVVGACFLAVGAWFGSKDWYRLRIVWPASAAIGGYSLAWFMERSLGVELPLFAVVAFAVAIGVGLMALKGMRGRLADMSYVAAVAAVLTVGLRLIENMIP